MSNYYGVKCLDCDDIIKLQHGNHAGEDITRFIHTSRDIFEELGEQLPGYPVDPLWNYQDLHPTTIPAGWFTKHKGHKLVAWSEYGYPWGEEKEDKWWGE